MRISFFIAKRYVKKQGKTKLIYRLSRLACYSMALGVAILLLVLSTMNGMERLLSALFYAYTPALKIESKMGKTFLSDKPLKDKIIHLSGVTDIIEILEATALIRLQNRQAIATIKGVSPNFTASDFYKNCARIDPVAFLEDGQPQATLGIGLSQLLRWAPHKDRVEVFYPKQGLYQVSKPYKRLTIEVNGCFSITRKIDSKYLIAPIHFVEGLTDGLHQRTYWEVVIPDTADLARTQVRIQKLLPDGFKVRNCQEQNEARRRAIFIERLSVYFVFALVLLLASLHIFFMLCMLILHKQKDIATLIALGATPAQVGRIFLYNGLLVSLEGMAYGFFIGWSLAFLQQKFGMITFTTLRGKVPYPIEIHHLDGLYTAILTILVTTLASLWPAKRAIELAGKG